MFKFAQQLVFGTPSEPEQSTASPTLNNKLGEVRQSRVSNLTIILLYDLYALNYMHSI